MSGGLISRLFMMLSQYKHSTMLVLLKLLVYRVNTKTEGADVL